MGFSTEPTRTIEVDDPAEWPEAPAEPAPAEEPAVAPEREKEPAGV